jgi:hypothetical protein
LPSHRLIPASIATVATLLALAATRVLAGDEIRLQGSAQTIMQRVDGELWIEREGVRFGRQRLAWNSLISLAFQHSAAVSPGPERVQLSSGEHWRVRVTGHVAGMLQVQTLLGEMSLPTDAMDYIDFSEEAAQPSDRTGVLLRRGGGPVPGRMLEVTPEHVTIDSPLGRVNIERGIAARYVFRVSDERLRATSGDVVTLIDGSTLYGATTLTPEGVEVASELLGVLRVPWSALGHVRRRHDRVTYLAPQTPVQRMGQPLVAKAMPMDVFHQPIFQPGLLDGWRTQPKLRLVYELPEAMGRSGTFRATLRPIPGARGTVKASVLADNREVWADVIEPDATAREVSVSLGAAKLCVIEVDYANPRRFPAGIDWLDPVVLWSATTAPQ